MADEITVNARLGVSNGGFVAERNPGRLQVDQATQGGIGSVQTIGTTYEAIALGDVSTEGYAQFINLDASNFVDIGIDVAATFYPVVRLLAGETAVFRVSTQALYAKADTAAVKLDVFILEA